MLFLNGERYTLKDKDYENLKKDFGFRKENPKPISINYPESSYTYDPVNKKRIGHQNHPVLLNSSFIREGSSTFENWIYCDKPVYGENNGKLVGGTPKYLHFKNFLNINNAELLFFLAYCSPLREGSPLNHNNAAAMFTIAQPAKDAANKIKKDLGEIRKRALILDKENGLSLEVIQEMCEAFFIPRQIDENDKEGSEDIMRVDLDAYITTKERLEIFFKMLEMDEGEREVRALVGKAYTNKIIGYDMKSQSIVYYDGDGGIIEPAKKVVNAGRHKEEAVQYFKKKQAREKLEKIVEERLGFSLNGQAE